MEEWLPEARWLIWVNQGHACFGLIVNKDHVVISAPPIARFTLGMQAAKAKQYYRARGAEVRVLPAHGGYT